MGETVGKNLEKLLGNGEGSMGYSLRKHPESIGGNAGHWMGYPCLGANFYFNPNTGEIKYFGNFQSVPEEIRGSHAQGTFRIAIDLRVKELIEAVNNGGRIKKPEGVPRRIVETIIDGRASYVAQRVLEDTVREYNTLSSIKEE